MLLLYQIINRDLEGCEINLSAVIGTDMFHDQDKYEKYILSVSSVHKQTDKTSWLYTVLSKECSRIMSLTV